VKAHYAKVVIPGQARNDRCRGFTLIELLVALGAMALLAILSWRGLDGMTRAHAQTEARADEVLTLQVGLAQWAADLDALIQIPQMSALEWNGRVMRMTRRGTASVTDGVRVVAWTHREGQWLRWQSPPLVTRGEVELAWQQADQWARNPADEQRRHEVAVTPLADWQVFYFRGDSWTNPQSSDAQAPTGAEAAGRGFPLQQQGAGATRALALPDGVRILIDLPARRALAGRITRDWVNPTVVGGGKS
jgi:general secretion pathway protein J